jgi:hypothetical protein
MSSGEAIKGFLAKYTPEISTQTTHAREHLASHFPRGYELVYDNYNALVFAFASSDRASDAVLSIAAYPKWVTLFFAQGASLEDPSKVLEGTGSKFRSVRLKPLARLQEPAVQALIHAAKSLVAKELEAAPSLTTVIKSVSAAQRARKPPNKAAAPKAPAKRTRSGA